LGYARDRCSQPVTRFSDAGSRLTSALAPRSASSAEFRWGKLSAWRHPDGWSANMAGPTVFYGFGVLGLIWAVFWVKVVKSDPATHPDLSPEERVIYADHSFGVRYNSLSGLAWRAQLKDSAVWAAIFALFCGNWALYFLLSWLPSYLRDAHALTLSTAGLFAAGPWASYLLFGNVAASLADAAIGRGRDVTVIRKLVLCPAFIVAAACLYGSQAAATSEAAMGVLCAATGALGVASSAYSPNFLELVPGRAALFIAFGNTLATIPGIAGCGGYRMDSRSHRLIHDGIRHNCIGDGERRGSFICATAADGQSGYRMGPDSPQACRARVATKSGFKLMRDRALGQACTSRWVPTPTLE